MPVLDLNTAEAWKDEKFLLHNALFCASGAKVGELSRPRFDGSRFVMVETLAHLKMDKGGLPAAIGIWSEGDGAGSASLISEKPGKEVFVQVYGAQSGNTSPVHVDSTISGRAPCK